MHQRHTAPNPEWSSHNGAALGDGNTACCRAVSAGGRALSGRPLAAQRGRSSEKAWANISTRDTLRLRGDDRQQGDPLCPTLAREGVDRTKTPPSTASRSDLRARGKPGKGGALAHSASGLALTKDSVCSLSVRSYRD